jgi:hypothetical protein
VLHMRLSVRDESEKSRRIEFGGSSQKRHVAGTGTVTDLKFRRSDMSGIGRMTGHRNMPRLVAVPQPVTNPVKMDPDELKNSVRDALLARTFEERGTMIKRIGTGMADAGFNIRTAAVLLGIYQDTVDDLTPSDLAYLVRYARINNPEVLKAVAGPLTELLRSSEAPQRATRPSKAA